MLFVMFDRLPKTIFEIRAVKSQMKLFLTSQLRQNIIWPNRRHFDARGRLRDGWRRFELAETMVDIFELYIQAVAAELDVPVFWVDSWYYHVHAGGIHCGTNVLRRPSRAGTLPNVWSVPNLIYNGKPLEFEGEEITVPAR